MTLAGSLAVAVLAFVFDILMNSSGILFHKTEAFQKTEAHCGCSASL